MHKFTLDLKRKSGNVGPSKGNEMISSNDRYHFHVKSSITRHLRNIGKKLVEPSYYSEDKPCKVHVCVFSPTRRRMDAPNWYPTVKALLDGFTDAGFWTDDNNDVIRETIFSYGGLSGTEKYRMVIAVTDVDKDYVTMA